MAPLSWKGAGAVLAVGWFTWVLSVIAAVSDAGTLDSYDRGYSQVKWRALCECSVVLAETCRKSSPPV